MGWPKINQIDQLSLSEKPNVFLLGNSLPESLSLIGQDQKIGKIYMKPIKVFSMR